MASENDTGLGALGQVQAPASAYNEALMAEDDDLSATALANFLMCMYTSLDAVNYSRFRALLESAVHHGQRCCALLENPTLIQKSLWKFEHAMKQYMLTVMQSWKTTGCTLIFYTLKEGDMLLLGFYCPMGFIFVEMPPKKKVNRFFNYYEIRNALKDLVPDSSYEVWKDVIQVIDHGPPYESECRYQARDLSDTNESFKAFTMGNCRTNDIKCVRQRVQVFLGRICEASKWVKSLMVKSDRIYEYLVSSDFYRKFYKTLKQKKTRLGVIMDLEVELRGWLSRLSKVERFYLESDTDVLAIIDDNEFWNDGYELLQALAPLLEIPNLVDTLVPSAGYLGVAIDKAKGVLKTYSEHQPWKFKPIWDYFESWRLDSTNVVQAASSYLSPVYILNQKLQEELDLGDEGAYGASCVNLHR